jgi:CO/xanthine dehydrogenase FAD-binding subunit
VHEVRVAVGCVGPTPRRLRDVEGLLSQKELPAVRATLDAAGALAGSAADAITDLHGSAEYKAYLVGVLLRRAFERAYQQAIGGNPSDAEQGKGTA